MNVDGIQTHEIINLLRQRKLNHNKREFAVEPWGTSIFRCHDEEENWTKLKPESSGETGKSSVCVGRGPESQEKKMCPEGKSAQLCRMWLKVWVGLRQRIDIELATWKSLTDKQNCSTGGWRGKEGAWVQWHESWMVEKDVEAMGIGISFKVICSEKGGVPGEEM